MAARVAPFLALLVTACAANETPLRTRSIVTGVISFEPDGRAQLVECGTARTVRLGAMAHGHYLHLNRRVRELSSPGQRPVTVEVSGYLRRADGGPSIADPGVLALYQGACTPTYHAGHDADH